jgi:ABC-type transport system involved in multi-copper enzyme maturation permease subunit
VIALVRAEWLKLRTTAAPWVLAGLAAVVTALLVLVVFRTQNGTFAPSSGNGPPVFVGSGIPHTVAQLRNLAASCYECDLFALLIGVLCVTSDFRHKTVTAAFLASPRRWRLIGSKLLTAALVGVALAVMLLVGTLVGGGWALAAQGGSFGALARQVPAVAPGVVLVFALFAVLGVGIGSLLTNQVAAIVVALGWFLILEGILVALVPAAGRWVPSGAAQAAADVTRSHAELAGLFAWWQGALLLLLYGAVFAAAGAAVLARRDIT